MESAVIEKPPVLVRELHSGRSRDRTAAILIRKSQCDFRNYMQLSDVSTLCGTFVAESLFDRASVAKERGVNWT
jgi:hypothetical protein